MEYIKVHWYQNKQSRQLVTPILFVKTIKQKTLGLGPRSVGRFQISSLGFQPHVHGGIDTFNESRNYKEFGKASISGRRSAIFNIRPVALLMRQIPFAIIFSQRTQ